MVVLFTDGILSCQLFATILNAGVAQSFLTSCPQPGIAALLILQRHHRLQRRGAEGGEEAGDEAY